MIINDLLESTYNYHASDLHLLVGLPPMIRFNGELKALKDQPILSNEQIKLCLFDLLNPQQKDLFLVNKEIDFSFAYGNKARFRINAYHEKNNMAVALRLLPNLIPTLTELGLPRIYEEFTKLKSGLILVTGPTGHGKSTTLAALIEMINQTRSEHIITIEDPIEYVYQQKKSMISQRELHGDTHSWEIALRSALREDPNVVLVGEMRDYETIAAAITIAETGHLVFATLHTNSAGQTVDRIVDVFPEHQQAQIRMQLAFSLEAVLSQRLLPTINGGRIPATEILLATPAIKATIREGKSHLIDNIIQTSSESGMMTLEYSLAALIKGGKISLETALSWSLKPDELMRLFEDK